MDHSGLIVPKSVPQHLITRNPELWSMPETALNWAGFKMEQVYVVSGSSFVDASDLLGPLGNPFIVVVGDPVYSLSVPERLSIVAKINAAETVFVNACTKSLLDNSYELNLTIYTPSGEEMGVCVHGFIGAVKTLLSLGHIKSGSKVGITTTIGTLSHAIISADGDIALEFTALPGRKLMVSEERLASIYGTLLDGAKNLGVLSVGSPKLTLELPRTTFTRIRQHLDRISHGELLALQQETAITGIHLFCRNQRTLLPEYCLQTNAYAGKENLVDRATGNSNAAQVSGDEHVRVGQSVDITQYSMGGPSAVLRLSKGLAGKVRVSGAAVLFNFGLDLMQK